jgi:hypothetical protein
VIVGPSLHGLPRQAPQEAMKVDCGKAHFEGALGVSYARVSKASEIE